MRDFLSRKSPLALAISIAATSTVSFVSLVPFAQAQDAMI